MTTATARNAQKTTRRNGRETRSRLLDHASALFMKQGYAAVSIAGIAASAGAFPSQITYHFKSKEALFVEAACRELLHLGAATEAAAAETKAPAAYREALARAVAASPAPALMIEAMALARRRADLAAMIARTFERLHEEGARAFGEVRAKRGWSRLSDPRAQSQRFWDIAFGVSLRVAGTGGGAALAAAEMLTALDVAALE